MDYREEDWVRQELRVKSEELRIKRRGGGKGRIGVVGGALTPGWVIEEIAEGMHRMVSQCR
jgi:4-hydroxy-3-methylbut-2-enyl diphosphate reductase IspH